MISVITIVKNDKKNIVRTMRSVLSQDYADMEYIIKNANSDDGTTEIIEYIKKLYPHKKILHINKPDLGIYNAMNQAVSHCKGEWILFMNSGDTFYKSNTLSSIFKNNLYPRSGVLYGDTVAKGEAGVGLWKANLDLIRKKMPFCHQSCFIKRDLLVQYPFDEQYKIAGDYSNLLDLYQANVAFVYIDEIVSVYRLDGISSSNFTLRHKEKENVRRTHGISETNVFKKIIWVVIEKIKELLFKFLPNKILLLCEKLYIKIKYPVY